MLCSYYAFCSGKYGYYITLMIICFAAASKLVKLNPVAGLLSRRHVDLSFERALRQTITSPHFGVQPDVPLSLLPDITSNLIQSLNQHGAILQLPPKPEFSDIQVATNTISLEWGVQDHNTDVSSDRTLTFSLHCYGDIPYRLKTKLSFKKKLRKLVTPESGFEDMSMSEFSNESKNMFTSLPTTSLGSRNSSLVTQTNQVEEESKTLVSSLLPEPVRLPKRRTDETKLPQIATQSASASLNVQNLGQLSTLNGSSSGRILNLPPLIINKPEPAMPVSSVQTMTTSGVFDESDDAHSTHMSTVDESEASDQHKASHNAESASSLSSELSSNETKVNEYTRLGRFCQGYAFEEIYCGEETNFQYSGLVAGASYFFRVRCHNAAGWGPWSDTVRCMTTFHQS